MRANDVNSVRPYPCLTPWGGEKRQEAERVIADLQGEERKPTLYTSCPVSVAFAGIKSEAYVEGLDYDDSRFLLRQGATIIDRLGPFWFPMPVQLFKSAAVIELVIHDGKEEAMYVTDACVESLMSGNGPWDIGLSVDNELRLYAHSRSTDAKRELATVLLGSLGSLKKGKIR